jgi:hypothetical protein
LKDRQILKIINKLIVEKLAVVQFLSTFFLGLSVDGCTLSQARSGAQSLTIREGETFRRRCACSEKQYPNCSARGRIATSSLGSVNGARFLLSARRLEGDALSLTNEQVDALKGEHEPAILAMLNGWRQALQSASFSVF